jgi:methionyl-tRNA synthetase
MKYLVTSALPYANGPLHFGHLTGVYLPADVFVRHLRLMGEKVAHISGSDEHGVAIMLNAQKAKRPYKEYVDEWHADHKQLFKNFDVDFDFFGQTSAPYHAEEVVPWFHELNKRGMIETEDCPQLQCQSCHNHLPDRFVKGTCYQCGYADARGDECPNCGIIIDAIRLKEPQCQICFSHSIKQVISTQYYLKLSKYHKQFRQWFEGKKESWRKTVWPFVDQLTSEGLQDRAITRDLDWGIDVPVPDNKGKKLYVWFDAPIGYVSNTREWLRQSGSKEDYMKDWWQNKDVRLYHFIGKDNIIFHTIIFPVMSLASGRAIAPYDVPANQYLNLEGKQFSKSSGWYVDAHDAVKRFGPDALRYYLLSILPDTADSSFTWEGMQAKVNNELANNYGNLVNRCLKFMHKNWPAGIEASVYADAKNCDWYKQYVDGYKNIHQLLGAVEIRKALEQIMSLGHHSNLFFSERAPWAEFKVEPDKARYTIAHTALQIILMSVILRPYLPTLSRKALSIFGAQWEANLADIYKRGPDAVLALAQNGLQLIAAPEALVPKIEDTVIAELNEQLRQKTQA